MLGFRKNHRIYLDHASAPPVLSEALHAVQKTERIIGNPGAIHAEGVAAKQVLENSRARIAALLGCKAREVVFTSGLTESNNLAILGYVKYVQRLKLSLKETHWIVSSIEHDSILACFQEIEALGGVVSFVEPNEKGIILPHTVEKELRPETVFVSVGWANNEIGVVQPLAKIAQALRAYEKKNHTSIVFHSDAGQAPLYLPTIVHSLSVDLLSIGANKLYGPHGIGALYIGKHISFAATMLGGKQERGLRAGTESVALSVGFAEAFEIVARERTKEAQRIEKIRNQLMQEVLTNIPGAVMNGDMKHMLPHMLNISISRTCTWMTSEYITLALDQVGIAVSTKSACREGEESRSHVVAALGGEEWRAQNTIRFSLGRSTRASDVPRIVRGLTQILATKND